MRSNLKLVVFGLFAMLLLFGCKSELNSPGENGLSDDLLSYKTIDSDIGLLKNGGMPLGDAAGVFSIGWNEIFRPIENSSETKGMAFAVAFGEQSTDLTHLRKYGLDMGDVFINYGSNHIEMFKITDEMRGTVYSLFERPFGHSENLLEFIPNTEYQFEVTGSEEFAPTVISLTSPDGLMEIKSYSNGQLIDPSQDLTITWSGGNIDGKVGIRLMPHLRPPMIEPGRHGNPGRPMPPPPMDRVIFVVLDTNTGTYTFTAQEIQQVLNELDADGLMVEVSQISFEESEHDNGSLISSMRNGDNVMLRIQS